MDPAEFLTFAGAVVTRGKAGARSAVSRAYYSVFHLAVDIIATHCDEGALHNAGGHTLVANVLICLSNAHAKKAGSYLSDLHGERHRVDYRLQNPMVETQQYAMIQIETATETKKLLEQFRIDCASNSTLVSEMSTEMTRIIQARK